MFWPLEQACMPCHRVIMVMAISMLIRFYVCQTVSSLESVLYTAVIKLRLLDISTWYSTLLHHVHAQLPISPTTFRHIFFNIITCTLIKIIFQFQNWMEKNLFTWHKFYMTVCTWLIYYHDYCIYLEHTDTSWHEDIW